MTEQDAVNYIFAILIVSPFFIFGIMLNQISNYRDVSRYLKFRSELTCEENLVVDSLIEIIRITKERM